MPRTRLFNLVYVAANSSLILYGVFLLAMPEILYEPFYQHIYPFPPEAVEATAFLKALFRLLGFFNLIPGVTGLLLLRRIKTSQDNWITRVIIISTTGAYLGPIVFDNTVGSIGFFEILEHILFILIIVLGFVMWKRRGVGDRHNQTQTSEITGQQTSSSEKAGDGKQP